MSYGTHDTRLKDVAVNIGHHRQAFFFSVPSLNDDKKVLRYQQAFVDKVLSLSLGYDHVLYCITNEIHPIYSPEWGYYWAGYVKKRVAEQGKRIEVTEMLWETDFRKSQQKQSFNRPDVYTFFEASQNSANPGQENGDYMQIVYEALSRHPRPINHVKIYGADLAPFWAEKSVDAERRFWRNILGGSAASRFGSTCSPRNADCCV